MLDTREDILCSITNEALPGIDFIMIVLICADVQPAKDHR